LGSLWGVGVFGLSEAGRSRFEAVPDVVTDDLRVDRQFAPDEVESVECAPVLVAVPLRARDLFRLLRHTHRGKAQNAGADPHARACKTIASTLPQRRGLATAGPSVALDAAKYAGFAVGARLAIAGSFGAARWERDDSSRRGG
jgi:hypothetical protein